MSADNLTNLYLAVAESTWLAVGVVDNKAVPTIQSTVKPVFLPIFDGFVVLTSRSNA